MEFLLSNFASHINQTQKSNAEISVGNYGHLFFYDRLAQMFPDR